jgi:hypothetical protein
LYRAHRTTAASTARNTPSGITIPPWRSIVQVGHSATVDKGFPFGNTVALKPFV